MSDFNLTEAISNYKAEESQYRELERLPTDFDIEELVSNVVAIPNSPLDILQDDKFNDFSSLMHHVHLIKQSKYANMIYQVIVDSLKSEVAIIEREGSNIDAFDHKLALSRYGYLLFVTVSQLTNVIDQYTEQMATMRKRKGKEKSSTDEAKVMKDQREKLRQPMSLFIQLMSNVCTLLKANLIPIFQTQTELSTFILHAISNSLSCAFKTQYVTKEKDSKVLLLNYICLCAKNQQQYDQISQIIVHHIKLSEHLPEFMAEVLTMLVNDYDNKSVLDTVLNELTDLNVSNDSTKLTLQKHLSQFLVKLSQGLPHILIDYDEYLLNFIGTSSIIRGSIIEAYENILKYTISNEEFYVEKKERVDNILETIHSRIFDIHFNVRQKCLNLIDHILRDPNRKVQFKDYRLKWVTIATQFLEDKTTYSRKAALSLLGALVLDHPYNIDGQKLSWKFYWNNYLAFNDELKRLSPNSYNIIRQSEIRVWKSVEETGMEMEPYYILKEHETNEEFAEEFKFDESIEEDNLDDLPENINEIILKRAFCRDACTFIAQIHKSVELACLLFHSKSKLDAIHAMDYFVILDAYDVETAKIGIKQMIHLVWRNGSNEDDIKVLHKLIESYVTIFLTPPPDVSREHQAIYIASQLISLTFNCNEADLISLGRLIYEIYTYTYQRGHKFEGRRADWINDLVISVLWKSFSQPKYEREKTGSIIILTMLAEADNEIILQKLETLLEYGLKNNTEINQSTTYSCIALRKSVGEKGSLPDYSLGIEKLKSLLLVYTDNGEWYHLAEEALTTLYEIDSNVDQTSSDILKLKAMSIFGENEEISNQRERIFSLSQFIFLLGHVGLKTIVYLEKCEAEFKKKRIESNADKNEEDVELEMIGGSNEDDFTDVIQNIREKELLYGENSLLAKFVPLILEILVNRKKYDNDILQRQATLCLSKFMCISPFFCEQHLELYLKLIKTSKDTIIRSNGILGLGDMAVSFNNLIDERRDELYVPLLDKDITVQRTCLMTVTFLILAGQIKVKGQLAQLSKLLIHEDPTIKEMTKLFFLELATKDNAIYNGFIDMVVGLNLDKTFSEDSFKSIIKYVSQFLKKDKHRIILIKKFYERLLKETDERNFNNLSFCLKELIRRDELNNKSSASANEVNENGENKKAKKQQLYKEITSVIDAGYQQTKLDELEKLEEESNERLKRLRDIDIEIAENAVDEDNADGKKAEEEKHEHETQVEQVQQKKEEEEQDDKDAMDISD